MNHLEVARQPPRSVASKLQRIARRGGRWISAARLSRVALLLAVTIAGCGDSPAGPDGRDVAGGVDLDVLFAPPTASERAAVEAEWASRAPRAEAVTGEEEWQVPFSGGGFRARVMSHVVDGHRHYGAILEPADPPSGPVPVLVYAHGGDGGTSVDEMLLLATALGLSARDYILVAPSFRSESLRIGGGAGAWESEGAASPWDRDVDDALSLLEVALGAIPFADEDRIGVVGFSRGGTVGLLMAIRDSRIDAVVSFFAPTDFFGSFVRDLVREVLLDAPPRNLPGLDVLARDVVQPLREGEIAVEEVRLELLRRSPARFAARLPSVQIHHGTADGVVPVEEAGHLEAAMTTLGRSSPEFESHVYEGAGHNPLDMPQAFPRARSYLERELGVAAGAGVRGKRAAGSSGP